MNTYRNEIGHIIGTTGQLIHHAANLLTITAQHLCHGDPEPEQEPHPQGDTYTTTELDGRTEPTEMHADHRPPTEYRIGFRSTK